MTHKLASNENFDIVRDNQTIHVPFDATEPLSATANVLALAAANPTAGNLAALDANGNPTDAGYRFEVRNGIPCIVQYA